MIVFNFGNITGPYFDHVWHSFSSRLPGGLKSSRLYQLGVGYMSINFYILGLCQGHTQAMVKTWLVLICFQTILLFSISRLSQFDPKDISRSVPFLDPDGPMFDSRWDHLWSFFTVRLARALEFSRLSDFGSNDISLFFGLCQGNVRPY